MRVREAGDPRLEAMFGLAEARDLGVKPVVRLPRSGPPGWLIAAGALLAALFLFWILESRRLAPTEPSTRARAADAGAFAAEPPPLFIPPTAPAPAVIVQPVATPVVAPQVQPRVYAPPVPQIAYYPQPAPLPEPQVAPPPPRSTSGPVLVIDSSTPAAPAAAAADGRPAQSILTLTPGGPVPVGRARASALANRATTVAQGTLIPAVLETAFDSSRPGFARAIVSRDVRGFDGSRVLIPRGSRLVGEYRSEVSPGQNRALINWTRLVRPDGATIALDSPAVDPLGRGGVKATVNSHFWGRFGDALLQSTVEIGRTLAMRGTGSQVIVAVPGATSTATTAAPVMQSTSRTPTLRVPAATSVSVFVARDLDFGSRDETP